MPSLKSLKTRIYSVKSTQKITKAMKMVAAAKLRKARERAEKARIYTIKTNQAMAHLLENSNKNSINPLITGRLNEMGQCIDNKHLIICAAGDRGLCGAFNSSIIKATKIEIKKNEALGKNVKVITIGKKAYEVLKHSFEDYIIENFDLSKQSTASFKSSEVVTARIIDFFNTQEVDTASIIFNTFVSVISQKTTVKQLIPIEIDSTHNVQTEVNSNAVKNIYEYEPKQYVILNSLAPRSIAIQIFSAMLENAASEQGARMTAMDSATRNAGEMIQKLSLQYNRTRQANITKELIEIISGAEAV
jgi:F-type H+-transporting ATPase subunit gamma